MVKFFIQTKCHFLAGLQISPSLILWSFGALMSDVFWQNTHSTVFKSNTAPSNKQHDISSLFILEPWPRHSFYISSDTLGLWNSVKLWVFVCCFKRQTTYLLTFHLPALQLLVRWCFSGGGSLWFCSCFVHVCKSRPHALFLIGTAVGFEGTGFPKPHQPAVDFQNDGAVWAAAKVWLCIFHIFDCRVAGFARVSVVVFL